MDIDAVDRAFSVLKANYGHGYQDGVLTGPLGGLHTWTLSSGCLPDDDDISPIGADSRFEYYWNFYQARLEEGNGPFIIEFRGLDYHAGFVDTRLSMERFTEDLFAGGVMIEQRRIIGESYQSDGSITPEVEP
jgi:hypothetical protein